jgi:hypothetical protein
MSRVGRVAQVVESLPLIPALERQRQEDVEFEASLGCIASSRPVFKAIPCLKQQQQKCVHVHLNMCPCSFDSKVYVVDRVSLSLMIASSRTLTQRVNLKNLSHLG